jgi:hypothetical protein
MLALAEARAHALGMIGSVLAALGVAAAASGAHGLRSPKPP